MQFWANQSHRILAGDQPEQPHAPRGWGTMRSIVTPDGDQVSDIKDKEFGYTDLAGFLLKLGVHRWAWDMIQEPDSSLVKQRTFVSTKDINHRNVNIHHIPYIKVTHILRSR